MARSADGHGGRLNGDGVSQRVRGPRRGQEAVVVHLTGGHRDVQVNSLELDQAHENHQPEVEHRRCQILTPMRKRFAKGPE